VNLLADECCDALFVAGVRAHGHDVVYVKEIAPGADDEAVLRMAAEQKRILLTEDKDFGEMVVRLQRPAYGLVLLRVNPGDSPAKLARLLHLLQRHGLRLPGSFAVLDRKKVRFRPL
jgi:predicted nuclease of predicted toxin-antitoxin system